MTEQTFDVGQTEAPENKEKVYLKPGYRKLTVVKFSYDKEEEGKTPLIIMECTAKGEDDTTIEFNENLYLSGKLNKNNVMSAIIRLQELCKGLTDKKIDAKLSAYTYVKKEQNGTSMEFTVPNPKEVCDYLNKKCAGKTAIFKVGGEQVGEGEDKKVFSKLAYSGFLYYTNKNGDFCKYIEERNFTESEWKYAVQKRKEDAPAHANGVADTKTLDDL